MAEMETWRHLLAILLLPFMVTVLVPTTDAQGNPLANGVYYLFIHAQGHRWVVKLLILR